MSKTALITGGAKRIGRAISLSLAEQGFDIIIDYSQSENVAKELVLKLRNLKVKILSLDNFSEIGEIEESGSTLLENSLIKSREVQRITGIPAIADDTGLEVEFLNGAPGVYSARYAGDNVSYQDNVRKLLSDLTGVEQKFRNAKFRTYISFCSSENEFWVDGSIEGEITEECFDWAESTYRDMYVTITIDSEYIPIPSYVGFNTELCRQSTHVMYSGEEAIHVVSNVENMLTLNHFFEIWGENLSATTLLYKDTSDGGEITLDVNGVRYEGDWSAIPLEGVISLDIVYTSPPVMTVEEDMEDDSLPGFSMVLVLASTLLAMAVIRRR